MSTLDFATGDAGMSTMKGPSHGLKDHADWGDVADGPAIAKANILIIEDFKPVHDLIRAELADHPYNFLSAYDAISGLSIASAAGVDLVLLDLDLPDLNGFDVCRQLKSDPATMDIGVIFLTASAGIDEKHLGLGLEAYDYITKPFDPEELGLRIGAALRVKRLLDRLSAAERGTSPINQDGHHRSPRHPVHLSLSKVLRARETNLWGRTGPKRSE